MIDLSKSILLLALAGLSSAEPVNRYLPYPQVSNRNEGLAWPKGQAIPTFATPAPVQDTIMIQDLSKDEQITFSALQGRVNRKQPRLFLANRRSEEGPFTWLETAGLDRKMFAPQTKHDLLAKYATEIDGVVLYNPDLSPHYRNLAGTLAPQLNAIPVTPAIHEEIKKAGIEFKVLEDLTKLTLTTPLEIYGHMLEHYWPKSEKRIILSSKPHDERGGGDYHHTRDIAAATGAAVVWLDTRVPEERDLLRKFFAGMKAGDAIALGWYATERTGITTASEFGIGTMPSDHFMNASVLAGTDHKIKIPAVPRKPALQNKVYVAIFISDGDNIQYTQHAMRRNWDRIAGDRGKVPLNWTIAPGLVDIAPAIMNYYYGSATPQDCFVTGPSGMGYLMPTNTLIEPGAPLGESLKDPAMMDGYTRMTETYLHRSGLRVVTIWDDASSPLRAAYERNCRNLYGATVQNFKDMPSVAGSIENDRVSFDKLQIPYTGSYEHIVGSLSRNIRHWDGAVPLFLSYQVDVWGQMRANRVIELRDQMEREFPGKVEFVRADHYFNLHNEARRLAHNLSMSPDTKGPEELLDGTAATLWTAGSPGEQTVQFDFGINRQLKRVVIRHAGDKGMDPSLNTRSLVLESSTDGQEWKQLAAVKDNRDNVSDLDLEPGDAKHLRVRISNPGSDSIARIADVEIYGRRP